jgi:hypothetical protein
MFLLQDTYAVLPQNGEAQLRVFNGLNCSVNVTASGIATDKIKPLDFWKAPTLQNINEYKTLDVNIYNDSPCNFDFTIDEHVNVTEKQVTCNKYMMIT